MDKIYEAITDQLVNSGKRIVKKAGKVKDIGIAKSDLTEEDLRIERELTEIIHQIAPHHSIYAEEEHGQFNASEDLWVIDPISGTDGFISGFPHFGLVASHLHEGKVRFAAIYDPSVEELFIAQAGKGTLLNGEPVHVIEGGNRVIYNLAKPRIGSAESSRLWPELTKYDVHRNANSFAVSYCWVACGRYSGFVTLAKDTFTEFAGSLMITEAGGSFMNANGDEAFVNTDRLFAGGNEALGQEMLQIIRNM